MEAPQEMRRLVNGYQVSEAIRVAAAFRVSDLLADGPRDLAELADATGCHPDSMYRLLRALASISVYEELPDRRFGTTPLGETLESGRSESLAPWAEHTVKFSDLNMFVSPGGRERTEEEYDALLSASGFRRTCTVPTAGDVMVIEAALD